MNTKKLFLTLSLKEQICITIIALNLFCILVILLICCSLAYEILKNDFEQKKLYFYDKYKDYIESYFYFQNFCLLQYEEIIQRMNQQMRVHFEIYDNYILTSNFMSYDRNNILNIESYLNEPINIEEYNLLNNINKTLYYICFFEVYVCQGIEYSFMDQYKSLSSLIASHNINNSFIMPMFDKISIMETPIFFDFYMISIYSFNSLKIFQINSFF